MAARTMVTLADIEAARERIAGGVYYSPCVESIPLSQLTGAHIYLQARLPAAHRKLQGARRAQRAAAALAGAAPARRDRGVGRQSRAGHRVPREPARHSDDRGDAGVRRADQGHQLPPVRRERDPARRRPHRGARPRRRDRRARRAHVHPSVRQRRTWSPARARWGSRSSSRRPTSRRSSCRSAAAA